MIKLSSEQVAKKLGISKSALSHYILTGKVAAPPETMAGGIRLRLWTESEIERLREALPRIADGRKTRYKKKQSAVSKQKSARKKQSALSTQQSAKAKPKKNKKKKPKTG